MAQTNHSASRAFNRSGPALAIGLICVLGAAAIVYSTHWGPWAYSDGVGYIQLARNLLEGRGLGLVRASGDFQPLSLHPPLYPIALAGLAALGSDVPDAARWLNVALFAATLLLVAWSTQLGSGSAWLAAACILAVFVSPIFLELYSGAMSEPLYFAMGLLSVVAILLFLQGGRWRALLVAGLSGGMAALARYPGMAFVAAGTCAVLCFSQAQLRRRLRDTGTVLVLGLAPTFFWFRWASQQPGAAPARDWIWELANLWDRSEPIRGGVVQVVWGWIPVLADFDALTYLAKVAVLAVLITLFMATIVWGVRRIATTFGTEWNTLPSIHLLGTLAAFGAASLAIITAVYLFSQPPLEPSDLDRRILSPIYMVLLISVYAGFALLRLAAPHRRALQAVPWVATVITLTWNLPRAWEQTLTLHRDGAGFTSAAWAGSDTVQAAGGLREDLALISNESSPLLLYLGRPAFDLPELAGDAPSTLTLRFGDGGTAVEERFRRGEAFLVLFNSINGQLGDRYGVRAPERYLALTDGLVVVADLDDGAIFQYPPEGAEQ